METFYLILVIILAALAVSDLIVGVSNDAVNFLSSAIGSKAASFKVIMAIAALGVFVGATFSTGMMEVARKGIFHPENFFFFDLIVIFLAVMITDVVLLDIFNTYGFPTSTTVSIVFELLGAAVAISTIKIMSDVNALEMSEYINTAKALAIISGILLSVAIAFTSGAVVQYITRIVFSFNYKKSMKYFGAIYGGIAITAITYFILIKGAKSASFMSLDVKMWIKENTLLIMGMSFVGWTILLQLLNFIAKFNILKLVVLVGTFALAMAFAGNDLVNFIGVPLAGYHSFMAFIAEPGAVAETFSMSALTGKVQTPTMFLLLAGLIMVITLYTSKKAKSVVKTSLDLSRQGEGEERFGSSLFARSAVRGGNNIGKAIQTITPKPISNFIKSRFDQTYSIEILEQQKDDAPAFDMIRASVNLVVASILISIATSMKLPLSTTYVTFMVVMGTSLADKAWGNDSAVYRITGVISVIGGWFFTAFSAFSIAFIVAFSIYYGGIYAIVLFLLIAGYFMYRTHILHTKKEKFESEELITDKKLNYDNVLKSCTGNMSIILSQVSDNYINIIDGITNNNRKKLKDAVKDVISVNSETKRLKDNILITIKRLEEDSVHNGHYYVQVLDYLRETTHCLTYIAKPAFKHVDNNHKEFISSQIDDINQMKEKVVGLFNEIMLVIANNKFEKVNDIINEQHETFQIIKDINKKQIKRIKAEDTGTKNSLLFLGIMHESKNILLNAINLLKAQRDFVNAEKEPRN